MQAVVYHRFGEQPSMEMVPDPTPAPDGAVIRVEATGLCRSDWHGWQGRDPDIQTLPHVPGHEFAGEVVAVGDKVRPALLGQRVTMPFVAGCGNCPECTSGNQQVCDNQFQPGFTGWGSFAELVSVRYAEENLVPLPDSLSSVAAASLGCRMATAFRAVAVQGEVKQGLWLAVHGCGGVGLSAVMIGVALGARVIAVDIRAEPLLLAEQLGAEAILNARETEDIPAAIHELTGRGADVSLDALGSSVTYTNSVLSLRKRGRHVQVGLLTEVESLPATPMSRLIGWEIQMVGSHGMQAHAYPELFKLIEAGKLTPERLIDRVLPLESAPQELAGMQDYSGCGVTVFEP
ncbi:zinc-dependent alcohol dehydrogenase family protein [Bythopirellula goksoeyrii]|uniref:Alcohol dehydrogenase n=1 Tax=Bythopirellula goksoeyrii TaxID=1400387 RepID=A0A5B9QA83_9BACT|nr:zinc-dependent alcohol dehydrogenase family protein [Bythopirellula goksoeyrii]QEG34372.1 Alcohol dehydrogenase [Bythopirellula goksoeyrii]